MDGLQRSLGILLILMIIKNTSSVLVMRFQENGVASNTTVAAYPEEMDRSRRLLSVTLCSRFQIFFLHARGTFFKLMDKPTNREAMLKGELWVERVRPVFAHRFNFQILKQNLWAFRWYHICFTYDHNTHLILTYLDGELTNSQVYDVTQEIYGNDVSLGQGDDKTESFSGDLTQVNVWDEVLGAEEIESIALCKSDPKGNYISWTTDWKLKNVGTYELPLRSLCDQNVGTSYFWFPGASIPTAYYLCEALGTHLPTVKSEQEKDDILQLAADTFPNSTACHFKLWTALTDVEEEGVWKYFYNGLVDEDSFWSPGEPNGLVYENCGAINKNGIDDLDCSTNMRCAVCKFTEQKRFSLLGTCEAELRNVYFVAYKEGEEDLMFKGYGEYHIRLSMGQWVWVDVVNNLTVARMELTEPNYPMGRRDWKLEREVCDQTPGGLRTLLLTPCSDNDFTCNDASCIPLSSRCDLRYDCRDKSDEKNCNPIAFPEEYQQHLPPRPNEYEEVSLPITLDTIIEALGVQTLEMTTEVTYIVRMTWKENRVDYLNAKKNNSLNLLPYSTFKHLWTPMINFVNTDGNHHTEVDKEAQMFINRLHDANKRDEAAAEEVDVFYGDFNTISIQRKYTTIFSCSFDLQLYPFDDQQCAMHFSISSAPTSFLYFHPESSSVSFLKIPKLIEYEVGDLRLETDNTGFYSDAKIIIPLRRLAGYAILNIYTPSLVLLIVSYVTLYFRPTIFDVRMMSALTAQLVIATFFSQVSSALPKTSYFKMVDVWLLFCIGITFLVIIFHAIVDALFNEPYYKDKSSHVRSPFFNRVIKVNASVGEEYTKTDDEVPDEKYKAKQMVLATKIVTLCLFIIFNVIYWGYILSH